MILFYFDVYSGAGSDVLFVVFVVREGGGLVVEGYLQLDWSGWQWLV